MQSPPQDKKPPQRDLEVITTHMNADYDALASMLAAAKLYPDAMLVLPGAQERNLRNFFVESTCYFFNFVKLKDVDFERVGRLIMVDTRQIDRIGPLASLAEDPQVEIHAYDHHPDSETDVAANMQVVERTGATVTILSRYLREKQIELNEDEATLLALGIYEDTGSLTFTSTTQEDYQAAAWLLGQGANLNLVSSLITRELTAEEVGLLNDMIHSIKKVRIGEAEVIITEVSRESYVAEFAVLVHRLMEMESPDALFALGRFEGRVYLVARSRLPEVDVGMVAVALGGGGHPTAASATLRGMTLVEARQQLTSILSTRIHPTRKAREIMTGPVISVPPPATLEEAHNVMSRYGLSLLPVVEKDRVQGIIGVETVERALRHNLGGLGVGEYMDPNVTTLDADDSLSKVEQVLVNERQLMVPVKQDGALKGVITRDDYFSAVLETPVANDGPGESGFERTRYKNIAGLMRERLPREVIDILAGIGLVAQANQLKAYLVGGSVRDLFLRRENLDLDLVIEGDAMEFAQTYAKSRPDVRVRTHKKFRTAKLIFPDGLKIDLATARLEYYNAPAALPVVELSSLKLDLYRRDFTINTLSVSLVPGEFGKLLDFYDGLRDLKGRAIRVLHNLSFVEDPTRIFRAVRFEQRFGFKIGKFSEALIRNALKIEALKYLSGDRLFGEYKLMMDEDNPVGCLRRLADLNLLEFFHENIRMDPHKSQLVEEEENALAWYKLSFLDVPVRRWLVFLLGLADGLKENQLDQIMERFALAPKLRKEIRDMRRHALGALHHLQRAPQKASEVYRLLHGLRPAYMLYIMAKAQKEYAKKSVSQFLGHYSSQAPIITGGDLGRLGFHPGPGYKEVLERVLAARLDGEVKTKKDELELVKREFAMPLGERA